MKKVLFFVSLSLFYISIYSQNIVNNGYDIVINSGAYLYVGGDYINETVTDDGKIDIDGKMIIKGDWLNNSSANVSVNIEAIPDGEYLFSSTNPQSIGGTHFTDFEDLSISGGDKTLNVTDNSVYGILSIDAALILNAKRLMLQKQDPTAINYISHYILSETSPPSNYGEIQWNIGAQIGTFIIPFGTGNASNDLQLEFSPTTAAQPNNGYVVFATYPTDCANQSFPVGVANLDDDARSFADRYWIIDAQYTQKPNTDIVFTYTAQDINYPCNELIVENELVAVRYKNNQWIDWLSSSITNTGFKTVSVSNIPSSELSVNWCLYDEYFEPEVPYFYVPNAFSPNGNNLNDIFGPIGIDTDALSSFDFYIYDRWGERIFYSDDPHFGWDGKVEGSDKIALDGVYSWILLYTINQGETKRKIGHVTLL